MISLFSALFWTTLGSVVGAVALYQIGALFGRDRMYALWERLPLVKVSDLRKTEQWFVKHGMKAIFFGRMIPIFRSLISVPALRRADAPADLRTPHHPGQFRMELHPRHGRIPAG